MIKINLLPQKRAKLRLESSEPGTKSFMIGVGSLAGAALIMFFAVDQPKRSKLGDLKSSTDTITQDIRGKEKQLDGYDAMKKAKDEADQRAEAINRLIAAKVVPANVLQELGEILTPNHLPTMTEEMAHKTGNGSESDPNKRFDLAWDPTHVWITNFTDNAGDGTFRLEGGAQGEPDVTQLSKRLQASAYFAHVAPASEERAFDRETGISYFRFVITGKAAY